MDPAYAPPYSSAKDPINVAGMVAKNMIKEDYKVTFWDELDPLLKKGALLIDVRTAEEFALNSLLYSINIPLEKLRDKLKLLPKDKPIILVCQQGKKSYFAYRILKQFGYFNLSSLSGGMKIYRLAVLKPVARLNKRPESNTVPIAPILRGKINKSKLDSSKLDDITEIDATGLSCPGPILKLSKHIKRISFGSKLKIIASDMSFEGDIVTWCEKPEMFCYFVTHQKV